MNLAQMYALANSKSGYSRSDGEIYNALDEAGRTVFNAVLKEFRGFFIKFDEISITLSPTQTSQEYTLPSDLTQIVHLAERLTTTENWHPITPINITDALTNLQNQAGWYDFYADAYGENSEFGFYGPYLDAADTTVAQPLQVQKIRISPIPDANRFCQIAYTAKWLPITDASSKVMLPDEGTPPMLNYAIAELRRASDDSAAREYETQGDKKLSSFLTWLRARQIMAPLTIETYGPGE